MAVGSAYLSICNRIERVYCGHSIAMSEWAEARGGTAGINGEGGTDESSTMIVMAKGDREGRRTEWQKGRGHGSKDTQGYRSNSGTEERGRGMTDRGTVDSSW